MAALTNTLIVFMAMALIANVAVGTDYAVGGPDGAWDLSTDYTKWIQGKTFYTGDNLIFTYSAFHDLVEVSKEDYASCSGSKPILSDKSGKTVIPLTAAGTRYFICSLPSHCSSGMLVEIAVVSKKTESTSPATPTTPTTPTTPAPSPKGSPPPPRATPPTSATPSPAPKHSPAPSPISGATKRNNVGLFVTVVLGFGLGLFMHMA